MLSLGLSLYFLMIALHCFCSLTSSSSHHGRIAKEWCCNNEKKSLPGTRSELLVVYGVYITELTIIIYNCRLVIFLYKSGCHFLESLKEFLGHKSSRKRSQHGDCDIGDHRGRCLRLLLLFPDHCNRNDTVEQG